MMGAGTRKLSEDERRNIEYHMATAPRGFRTRTAQVLATHFGCSASTIYRLMRKPRWLIVIETLAHAERRAKDTLALLAKLPD